MTMGYVVNKDVLDQRCAEAVIGLREAFENIETIAKWLADHPNDGTDPLIAEGYDTDEAYAMRLYFETFETVRVNNQAAFDTGRKMTGLE